MNFKEIHVGKLIKSRVDECGMDIHRICKFFGYTESVIKSMYEDEDIKANDLLRWCKLLEYDFFRIYSQHLILFSPPSGNYQTNAGSKSAAALPKFRKNIYTKEIIYFILDKIKKGHKSKQEVMNDYKIPKTTLYKWISKYEKADH